MQLKDFVAGTLTQLVEGVVAGHNAVYQLGGRVNPVLSLIKDGVSLQKAPSGYLPPSSSSSEYSTTFVDFDIAIIASEDSSSKGGFGIFVGAIGAGAAGQATSASSQHSRIKFSLPVALPTGWAKAHDKPPAEEKKVH